MKRMNREEFFAKLAACDEERLKKVLWNLYWRGSAAMRERIEAEVDPQQSIHCFQVDPKSALLICAW